MARTIRRRRLEAKTDYKARFALLKSGSTRLVIRKTNRYIIAQFVTSNQAQDSVIYGITSKVLTGKGWPANEVRSIKNRAAAYLTGYLLGKKSAGKIKEAILDLGMHRNIQKSRIYSLLRGVIDAGIKIPCNKEILPSDEEISISGKYSSLIEKVKKAN